MYSPITGTGSGTAPVVNITFDYINKAHVKASVDGVVVAATWTGASQITFGAAVAPGSVWAVFRETPIDIPLVDFTNGSVLTEQDLDLSEKQLRFHQEEVNARIDYTNTANKAAIDAAASEAAAGASATSAAASEASAAASATSANNFANSANASANSANASANSASGSAISAAASASAAANAISNVDAPAIPVASRAIMAARVDHSLPLVLTEGERFGMFVFKGGNQSAHVSADTAQGVYVAPSSDPTGASGAWVRQYSTRVNVKWFGATGDGVTDDGLAIQAAIDFLHSFGLNMGGGGFYKGSPSLYLPAGHYYLGSNSITITHSITIEGDGSGDGGPQAFGDTHLRWADGVDGIYVETPNTSGEATVDGVTHDGSGTTTLRGLMLSGGFAGTEGEHHALVLRSITHLEDIYIRDWSGDGVKARTGNTAGSSYGGNTSTSRWTGVKTENCRIGFDVQGTDSNAIIATNCQGYQNRQAGLYDKNAAGSNTYIGWHSTWNGILSTSGYFTQVSHSGNYYAAAVGASPADLAANAPSGTTDDTAFWRYVGAGAPDASRPAWSGTGVYRWGGDYITDGAFPTMLIGCYAEGGGFSHFNAATLIIGGTSLSQASYAGRHINARYDATTFRTPALVINNEGASSLQFENKAGTLAYGSIQYVYGGGGTYQAYNGGHQFYTGTVGVSITKVVGFTLSGMELPVPGSTISIAGNQVLAGRQAAVANADPPTAVAPTGGTTIDAEGRTAIGQLIADNASLRSQLNAALAAMRAHGLIAP